MHLLVVILVIAGLLVIGAVAGRRFAAEQRKRGRWDQYGPVDETEPPPPMPAFGVGERSMMERLEVVGRWKGKVLRRRRPNEKP
jgi:hypothetical protein